MKRFITHPLTLAVIAIGVLYGIFGYLISPPMPKSLLIQYMVIVVIGVLLVMTFDDNSCQRLFEPFHALLGAPGLAPWRMLALVVVVGGSAALAYAAVKPSREAPVELRTVHPAPPSQLRVYGRDFNLVKLQNPLREEAPKGSQEYRDMVAEGREIYYKNCIFCHGDNLDGQGYVGLGLNPRPANFQDVGTIAQLQESYLFWRITTGGPGLPREGAPWLSAMPVWQEMLKEDEVWKAILFLYDYTGYAPRSWELDQGGGAKKAEAEKTDAQTAESEAIQAVYDKRCAQCHGAEGEGDGPAADYLYPRPRDFSLGVFKYKTTHADSEFPTDDDLRKTIRDGLPGTAMPAWGKVLTAAQIDGLIGMIKEFGGWDGETPEDLGIKPIELGEKVESSPESLARGAKLFKKACVQCHGEKGRGNVTSGKNLKDDWGYRIWPRNLTRPETWRWTKTATDVFQRISAGIRGTPMPEHTTTFSIRDRWDVANYAMTLRENAVQLSTGQTVVQGTRIEGALPTDPNDSAWDKAPPITFALVPNVVKEPRLFYSLNDTVTVRALFNDEAVALRLDVDDRTYSVPGSDKEKRYRDTETEPTRDAVAVQLPATIPTTSEKPWFRHGDPGHPVNMWFWRAPSVEPEADAEVAVLDATGPDAPPVPRDDAGALEAKGSWSEGRWQVVFTRPLATDDSRDLQFEQGRYIPIAFANWDGWAGQKGGRHTLTTWYWLLLEPGERPALVWGSTGTTGLIAGLVFLGLARRERRRFTRRENDAPETRA